MKAKRCPLCGGKPVFMEYAVPRNKEPDLWEETENGLEPVFLTKLIMCGDCGALGTLASISCDETVKAWNEGHILEWICKEPVQEVEDADD